MGKTANIITTEHLKKSTIEYLSMLYTIFNLNYEVMTDYEYKNVWLNETDINIRPIVSKYDISNYINIIDEFDLHHDYLQSMFNLVKKRQEISESLFNYVFDYVYFKINSSVPFIRTDVKEITNYNLFDAILEKEFSNAIKLRYNKDYGFAHLFDKTEIVFDKDIRLCVPFSRKDTPLYHSNFSSIILTMILTINYYITNETKLDENDYYLVNNNYRKMIDTLPEVFYKDWMSHIATYDNLSLTKVQETFHTIYSDISYTPLHPTILKKFLYVVNQSKLYYALEQYNVSFQDVIYNVYDQWQVGYTGTIYLNLNQYFPDDKFVFRNKIEDFDEKIEVRLAIEAYGSPTDFNKNEVLTININEINRVDEQISFIMRNGFNRGIVDLAGLFLDYKNRNIAEYLSKIIPTKRIIYLNDNHQGMEYSQIDKKYTPFHRDNFYYYDQCHTIGTDMSQPNDGYIAVIMNHNTRWTHFAQGIFRFRKLNHGTYMKIIYIHGDNERFETPLTNKDIYRIIETNERTFQDNQDLGIKFQLLKAMTRKISKNYLESNLLQEFMLVEPLNIDHCVHFIKENIIDLNDIIEPTHKNELYIFIKDLYLSIIRGNTEQLLQLITGNQSHQKQQEVDTSIERAIERAIERNIVSEFNIPSLDKFPRETYDIIVHLKCSKCFNKNSFPFFSNEYDALINKKKIYVSLNFFKFTKFKIIKTTPLLFVEFEDKILIEVACVALDYYITKLPIYNFNGILLNQHLYNKLNTTNPFKLDIDYRIIDILNIENYINPIKRNNYNQITDKIRKQVFHNLNEETGKAFYSIYRNLNIDDNYFQISFSKMPLLRFFVETYTEEEIMFILREGDESVEEVADLCDKKEHSSRYRIDNIYFNNLDNINGIDLTMDEYVKVQRINFDLVYHETYESLKI
jgi:hypothetical protein